VVISNDLILENMFALALTEELENIITFDSQASHL
jgi:hypothetical protein